MKVRFKITEVDENKKTECGNFIKVEIFNDNNSIGEFWQDSKTIKNNISKVGEEAYINLQEYKEAIL